MNNILILTTLIQGCQAITLCLLLLLLRHISKQPITITITSTGNV